LDRDGTAVRGTQQPDDQLRAIGPVVPAVAVMGKFAMASFEVGRGHVIEHERAFLEVAAGETGLDEGLLGYQPVQGGVDLAYRDGAEAERLAEGMAGRGGVEHARGGEFGRRIEQPGDDQGENEIAPALRRAAGEQAIKADTAGGGQRGEDMTMRQGAADFEPTLAGPGEPVPPQGGTQRLDFLVRPMGEIGEGAGFDLAVLAVALAEEDGGRRATVWNDGDEHEPFDQAESGPVTQ